DGLLRKLNKKWQQRLGRQTQKPPDPNSQRSDGIYTTKGVLHYVCQSAHPIISTLLLPDIRDDEPSPELT
ncbi:Pyruvate dehydrogenase E1 component subunit beta, partial [Dissostichus eleginoides]